MKLIVWPLNGSGTLSKQHCFITLMTALVPISGNKTKNMYRFVQLTKILENERKNSTSNPYSFPIIDLATQYRRQLAADCIPHVFLLVTKSLISLTVMRFSSESCSIKMANWRTLRKLLPISNSSLPPNIRNLK